MSSFPQKPTADLKSVKSLLENHNPRETYEILAAQIILANKRTQDLIPPSRVQTETRKIRITETDLHEIRTGRFCSRRWQSDCYRSRLPDPHHSRNVSSSCSLRHRLPKPEAPRGFSG